MKKLISALSLSAFLFAGCVTTVTNPDGSVSVSEVDYMGIQLMSSASIAAWAASQKDGISRRDAQAVVNMLNLIEEFHADGSAIDVAAWTAEIQKQVLEPRYQALGVVLVQLVSYQLERHGVATKIPMPDNSAGKILKAIRTGVMAALAPYLDKKA